MEVIKVRRRMSYTKDNISCSNSAKREQALKEKEELFLKHSKNLDEEGRASESSMLSVVRGAVRKAWMRHPTKLSFLARERVYVGDVPESCRPSGLRANSKWLYLCNICDNYFLLKDIEVDHIKGEHTLKDLESLPKFTSSVLGISWNDLQILCKDCHQVKTYAERYDMSFQEALLEKEVISVMNLKASGQRSWLKKRGITPASNAEKRREQVREVVLSSVRGGAE